MKLLKKLFSVFIAITVMLGTMCFVGAAPASESEVREFLNRIKIKDVSNNQKKSLSDYPDFVSVITTVLLDLKVDKSDFDNSNYNKLGYFLSNPAIEKGVDNPKFILNVMCNAVVMSEYASKYSLPDGAASDIDYSGLITHIKSDTGNLKKCFYWINKDKSKEHIKSLINGNITIKENDYDGTFLKITEEAIVNYVGGLETVFNDDEFFAKFVQSIIEVMKDGTIGLQLSETGFNKESTEKRSDAVNDYKKMGQYIVKNTLGYKGLEEGKDYEIVYDKETGYIKEIKNLSANQSKSESSIVSLEDKNSDRALLFRNAFIVFAIGILFGAIISVFILIERKHQIK